MSRKREIKLIKGKERAPTENENVPEGTTPNAKRDPTREMIRRVSEWVRESQQRKAGATLPVSPAPAKII